MSSGVPYLGSKISIISKSEIRYEGILYTVDTKESTVALAKVKSFGTEGRPTDRPLAPRDEVYEYIIFRANDIKDLHVCEPPKSHHGLPHDPAIVQQSGPISHYSTSHQQCNAFYGLAALQNFPSQMNSYPCIPSVLSTSHSGSSRVPTQSSQRKSPTSDAGVQVSVGGADGGSNRRASGREPLRQRNQMNYQPRRSSLNRQSNQRRNMSRRGRGRSGGSTTEKFENEYDFEQANAEFQELENKLAKNSIEDTVEQSPTPEDPTFAYDRKKSFFDDISCEATQRSKGLPRFDWRYERKLNVETFGVSANNAWLRRRRARGSMRRGYRGRGGYNRMNEPPKTVTFDETPAVKEVEVIKVEEKPSELPVIEVVVDKEKSDWPVEPSAKADNVWN